MRRTPPSPNRHAACVHTAMRTRRGRTADENQDTGDERQSRKRRGGDEKRPPPGPRRAISLKRCPSRPTDERAYQEEQPVAHATVQFSTWRSGISAKSHSLLETSTRSSASAWAAIRRSLLPR